MLQLSVFITPTECMCWCPSTHPSLPLATRQTAFSGIDMIEQQKQRMFCPVLFLWGSPAMKSILNICNTIGFLAFEIFCGYISETPLNVIKALIWWKRNQKIKILYYFVCIKNYGPSSNCIFNTFSYLKCHVVWRNYKAKFHQHISN